MMLAPLFSALSFLTRIPAPPSVHTDMTALRRAPVWFPAIGFLLGALYAGTAAMLGLRLPALVVAVLVLILDAFVTGALHIDGLADMADGFGGGRNRDDTLRIMRDHSIGAYGGVAITLLLLLKAVTLSELLKRHTGILFLAVAPGLARWSILLLSRLAPYARVGDAHGSGAICEAISRNQLLLASFYCSLVLLFNPFDIASVWLPVIVLTIFTAYVAKRKIGGITGDVLGANVVLAEALQFLTALLLLAR